MRKIVDQRAPLYTIHITDSRPLSSIPQSRLKHQKSSQTSRSFLSYHLDTCRSIHGWKSWRWKRSKRRSGGNNRKDWKGEGKERRDRGISRKTRRQLILGAGRIFRVWKRAARRQPSKKTPTTNKRERSKKRAPAATKRADGREERRRRERVKREEEEVFLLAGTCAHRLSSWLGRRARIRRKERRRRREEEACKAESGGSAPRTVNGYVYRAHRLETSTHHVVSASTPAFAPFLSTFFLSKNSLPR